MGQYENKNKEAGIEDIGDLQPVSPEISQNIRLSERMQALQDIYDSGNRRWNCIQAVYFLAGNFDLPPSDWLGMPEFGEQMDLSSALTQFEAPFVFQVCGPYQVAVSPGWETHYGVQHTGIILGSTTPNEPTMIFEKNCSWGELLTSSWEDMIARFAKDSIEIQYFRFFSLHDSEFQESIREYKRFAESHPHL
jgi:hypothetical protein